MSLIDSLYSAFGGKRPGSDSGSQCPDEAQILTYLEGKLWYRKRAKLHAHFAACDNCRSLLALLARFSNEPLESHERLPEDAVKKQAAKILAYAEADERKHGEAGRKPVKPDLKPLGPELSMGERKGFFISYPQLTALALIVCAIGVGVLYFANRHERSEAAAMQQLAKALKEERRSEMRISGDFSHSRYTPTRGANDNDDLQLKRALNKLKFAEDASAPADAQLALARVHIAFGEPEHARAALDLLKHLSAGGVESADVLNDLGVAQFQLANYGESIASFSKALDKSPTFAVALFNKALAEERAGYKDEAKRDWQQFINMSSDQDWKAEAQNHLNQLLTSSNQ
jgi:tetratricopeptide (TPR) repeat protein